MKKSLILICILTICLFALGCSSDNPKLTIDEKINILIKESVPESKLIKSEIITIEDGKKIVNIHVKGNEGFTNDLVKKAAFQQSANIFEKLYISSLPLKTVQCMVYRPFNDTKGNAVQEIAVKLTLQNETANKINWDKVDKINFDKATDDVWVHPVLSK
ncbi:hypothetical protein LJC10_00495 [Selenomonadales bacterium OttesenSCG-928-I06]|nr:hypothetical protein [Selenomonadales bacterium OttesenSCG-928-I06]